MTPSAPLTVGPTPRTTCVDACEYGGWGVRIMIAVSVMLFFVGPGLMIAGIAVLSYPNPRASRVEAFNRVATAYAKNDFTPLASMVFALQAQNNASLYPTTMSTVPVKAAEVSRDPRRNEGIQAASSRVFDANSIARSDLAITSIVAYSRAAGIAANTSFVPRLFTAAPASMMRVVAVTCSSSDCGGGSNCVCSTSQMQSKCTTQFSGSYTSRRGACNNDGEESCGTCYYRAYLTSLCVPVVFNPVTLTVAPSTRFAACTYPFTDTTAEYVSASPASTVSVRIMSENDPFIEMQRLTDGSQEFGWAESSQQTVGAALLVVGIVLVLIAVFIVVIMFKSNADQIRARKEELIEMRRVQALQQPTATVIQVGQPVMAPDQQQLQPQQPAMYGVAPGAQQQQPQQYATYPGMVPPPQPQPTYYYGAQPQQQQQPPVNPSYHNGGHGAAAARSPVKS